MTTLFIGGRINEFVLGRDFMESMTQRAGIPATVHTTSGPKTAERRLRDALDAGHPVIAILDRTLLPESGLPPDVAGMMPYPVVVSLVGGEPRLTDGLSGVSYPTSWQDLAAARAAYRPGKHRLLVFDRPPAGVAYADAVRAALTDTVRGMVDPPRSNFGLRGLDRWATALTSRAKDGWAQLFGDGDGLLEALSWLMFWIEGAGTGGGAYRAVFADYLDEVAVALGSRGHADAVRSYRGLSRAWSDVAEIAAVDEVPRGGADALRNELAERVGALAAGEGAAVEQLRGLL
jgi:hypothetical protein